MLLPRLLALGLVIFATAPASADDAASAAKLRLTEQVKALNANDATAFAATFREDGSFVILPQAGLEGKNRTGIAAVAGKWLAAAGGKSVIVTIDQPSYGKGTMGGWYFANLVVKASGKTFTYRATGVVAPGKRPDEAKHADYKVIALHVSEAVDDAVATKLATAGKLPALRTLKTADDDEPHPDYQPHQVAKTTWDPGYGVLVGSSAKELAIGKAVGPILAQWKPLNIRTTEAIVLRDDDGNGVYSADINIAHVVVRSTINGKTVEVPFRALVAFNHGLAGADKARLMVAHFSIATQ